MWHHSHQDCCWGVGRYTSYALQDPRVSWSLASVHIESMLVASAMNATGVSTASARSFAQARRSRTLVCQYGRSPPSGCDVSAYLAGTGACPRNLCYLDPCFACLADDASSGVESKLECGAHQDANTCKAVVGCAWERQASLDCWNESSGYH